MARLSKKVFIHESLSAAFPKSVVKRTPGRISAKFCASELLGLMRPRPRRLWMTGFTRSRKIGCVEPVILKSVVAMSKSFEKAATAVMIC